MDSDLTRLCAIPGHDDLTCAQVEDVLQLSSHSIQRLVSNGVIETKRHAGRGMGRKPRVRITRAAVVRYLVQHCSGDRAVILAAVRTQCPQYLPAVADLTGSKAADLSASASAQPSNVILMTGAKRPRKPTGPAPDHPGQMFLFPREATA